jgi:hypothetical protein
VLHLEAKQNLKMFFLVVRCVLFFSNTSDVLA